MIVVMSIGQQLCLTHFGNFVHHCKDFLLKNLPINKQWQLREAIFTNITHQCQEDVRCDAKRTLKEVFKAKKKVWSDLGFSNEVFNNVQSLKLSFPGKTATSAK